MTSSIYTRTAADIAKRALRLIRVQDAELPLEGQDRENAFDALNGFIKYLQNHDFNLWRETEAILPLVKGQQRYILGPGGDECFDEDDFIPSSLSAASISGDVLINLESTAGMQAAPELIGFNPTTTTQGWMPTDATVTVSGSNLTITNSVAAQGFADYELETTPGNTYILQADFISGTAGTANFEIRDADGLIISTTSNCDGIIRLEFVARQDTTSFRFQNVLGVLGLNNILSSMNYIDKSAGDRIGVFLDDNSLQWTNILYLSPFEIAEGLNSNASEGNTVYTYTNQIPRPGRINQTRYRDSFGNEDIPTTEWSRKQYFDQPDKATQGTVTKWYYSPQLNNGELYVWQPASSNKALLPFTYIRPFLITSDNGDEVDFPSEWFDLLSFGVADLLIAEYSVPENVIARVATKYQELLDMALGYDNDGFVQVEIDYEGRR